MNRLLSRQTRYADEFDDVLYLPRYAAGLNADYPQPFIDKRHIHGGL
jgi:hypothetical protein